MKLPWQPIETAPKDKKAVLLFGFIEGASPDSEPAGWYEIGFWNREHWIEGNYCEVINPSHWMPLAPPLRNDT